MSLSPLPQPGLAVYPHLTSTDTMTLTMKWKVFSKSAYLTHPDGKAWIKVKSKRVSDVRKYFITDLRTEHLLGVVEQIPGSKKAVQEYSVTNSSGQEILATECANTWKPWKHDSGCVTLRFDNYADEGKLTQIEYKNPSTYRLGGTITWNEHAVAKIEKDFGKAKSHYKLEIAAGMDPFPVLAVAIAFRDQ